jgi:hypothetical protein
MEDAGVFLAEALVQGDNLGSHPLVHCHVRHGRQQPAVTQLTLHHKKVKVCKIFANDAKDATNIFFFIFFSYNLTAGPLS